MTLAMQTTLNMNARPSVAGLGRPARSFTAQAFKPALSKRLRTVQPARAEASNTGSSSASNQQYSEEQGFRIERVSFGSILTPVGLGLLIYGFGAFFQMLPGGDVSSLLLIYGFPISVLGFALSYAQLEPVPCRSTPEAVAIRESQATDIQKQVREDVTRYRYGDEQHLEEALGRIFKFNQAGGIPRRLSPTLVALREEARNGAYTLVLEFKTNKDQMTDEMWETRKDKFQSFFGPGIVAELKSTAQGEDVALICDGSGAGRGGEEKKDVLPPLLPGMKPRVNTID